MRVRYLEGVCVMEVLLQQVLWKRIVVPRRRHVAVVVWRIPMGFIDHWISGLWSH